MIDRHEFAEEIKLRGQIRKIVRVIKEHRREESNHVLLEENRMRKVIRKLLAEADTSKPESSPHEKTGINVLEDLLHNIIPQVKDDFMQLTTDKEQRTSFRRHMIYNVMGLLKPPTVNAAAPEGTKDKFIPINEQEEIELKVGGQGGDEPMPPEFIPGADPEDVPEDIPDDEREKTEFGIPGEEETGRDFALETFNKVSSQILQAYNKLGNEEDRELFYDYLKTNLQLYFDKFENEITVDLPEPPASPEYEAAKGEMASPEGAIA
tara:strand:- start:172 stop:966 length:795 start_codon:yes stop_codon:yes gene_type:complete